MAENWRALNRANWDERVPVHLGPGGYDLAAHRAGAGRMDAIEEAELGTVAGLRILHPQCHIGHDSVALAQRGAAEVVGVDFSPAAVAAATVLAAECGVAATTRFVESDLYAGPAALPGEAGGFDLVFTTWGTISWLPDIDARAEEMRHHARPGAPDDAEGRPGWFAPCFTRAPQLFDNPDDYADPAARLASSRTVEWLHPLCDILGALRAAGLRLDWLHEHPRIAWRLFPALVQDADGLCIWPGRPWLPLALSLRAVREG